MRLSHYALALVVCGTGAIACCALFKSKNEDNRSLLREASWKLSSGTTRSSTISWVDQSGHEVQSLAASGEVTIFVDPTKSAATEVISDVTQAGGTVYAQLPAVGQYWAKVRKGGEAQFIASLRRNPKVLDVFPNVAVRTKQFVPHVKVPTLSNHFSGIALQLPPVTATTGKMILDNFTLDACLSADCENNPIYVLFSSGRVETTTDPPNCNESMGHCEIVFVETTHLALAAAHGDIVKYYLTNRFNGLDPYQSQGIDGTDLFPDFDDQFQGSPIVRDFCSLASMIHATTVIGRSATINHSVGVCEYMPDGRSDCGNVQANATYIAASNSANQRSFLQGILGLLSADAPGSADAIVVQAAGNSGTNLTLILTDLRQQFVSANDQIIEVGALTSPTQLGRISLAAYSNYSEQPGTMLYVPVNGRTNKTHTAVSGTSFAAPQIAYLVNELRSARPDLTPHQIRSVLFDTTVAPVRPIVRPNGHVIDGNVINDPFSTVVRQAAIVAAERLYPKQAGHSLVL